MATAETKKKEEEEEEEEQKEEEERGPVGSVRRWLSLINRINDRCTCTKQNENDQGESGALNNRNACLRAVPK